MCAARAAVRAVPSQHPGRPKMAPIVSVFSSSHPVVTRPHPASLRLLPLLALLCCGLSYPGGAAAQSCLDYRQYLHQAGKLDLPDDALAVAFSGDLAFVAADGAGLQVIDISNPVSPQVIGAVDTPGSASAVSVS